MVKTLIVSGVFVVTLSAWLNTAGAQQSNCEYPNVLIVQDRSGSMQDANKWTYAKSSLSNMLSTYQGVARFGLMLFSNTGKVCSANQAPCQSVSDCPTGSTCDYADCSAGKVDVALALNNASQINGAMNATTPNGNTPMGATLQAAKNYIGLHDVNRRNFVILLTDGQETCSGDPLAAVEALYNDGIKTYVVGIGTGVDEVTLNNLAQQGGTPRSNGPPYYYEASAEAALTDALKSVVRSIITEICDNKDQDCNGKIDEDPADLSKPLSQMCTNACGSGWQICTNGVLGACNAPQPQPEKCDGLDNDCDKLVDEPQDITSPDLKTDVNNCGFCYYKCPIPPHANAVCVNGNCSFTCQDDTGDGIPDWADEDKDASNGCEKGVCTQTNGGVEICDYKDNDCDGLIDEDASGTALGLRDKCGGCEFPVEVCNNNDDDCNGVADDGFNVGEECDTGFPGRCSKGLRECDPSDNTKTICKQDLSPEEEVCNGIDDDCDGFVDEDIAKECESKCGKGYILCENGTWLECNARTPTDEICDGIDNDCNGLVDDKLNSISGDCDTGEPGICSAGKLSCEDGIVLCLPVNKPKDEIAGNNLDDDCDGKIDEWPCGEDGGECEDTGGADDCTVTGCPEGFVCNSKGVCVMEGQCENTFDCPQKFFCNDDKQCEQAPESCIADADCPLYFFCKSGEGCKRFVGATCADDTDCPADYKCSEESICEKVGGEDVGTGSDVQVDAGGELDVGETVEDTGGGEETNTNKNGESDKTETDSDSSCSCRIR